MGDSHNPHGSPLSEGDTTDRLVSWKEIASLLDCDVRTAQRWEKKEGLPVHRHVHDNLATVYAYRSEIEAWLASRRPDTAEPPSKRGRMASNGRARILGGIVAFAVLVSLVLLGSWISPTDSTANQPVGRMPTKFVIQPPENGAIPQDSRAIELNLDVSYGLVISPDGRRIVYRVTLDGVPRLYLRSLAEFDSRLISGTEGVETSLFFAPDGESVGFAAGGRLKKVSFSGAPPQVICDIGGLGGRWEGAAWISEEAIVFAIAKDDSTRSRLFRVAAAGGLPQNLIEAEPNRNFSSPRALSGGEAVLFEVDSNRQKAEIRILSLRTLEQKVLLRNARGPAYLQAGDLVYNVKDEPEVLRAIAFDPVTQQVMGDPLLLRVPGLISADYVLSSNGTLVYIPSAEKAGSQLVWVDRQGKEEEIPLPPGPYPEHVLSPDGKKVVLTNREEGNLWVYDLSRGTLTRVTSSPTRDFTPIWTPDGKRLVYSTKNEQGWANIFWKAADGTGLAERLTTASINQDPRSFTPDGSLVFDEWNEKVSDVKVLSLADRHSRTLLNSREWFPRVSPDGRWLAYHSDETGTIGVYVRSLLDPEKAKWQVSPDAFGPVWGPEGRELFFLSQTSGQHVEGQSLVSVPIEDGAEFRMGKTRVLFDAGSYSTRFSVSPDGRRFLMLRAPSLQAADEIRVVLDWAEQLRQSTEGH